MNGKLSKRLRKLAKFEMSANAETIERELVLARIGNADRVINEPMTVRAFYLKLKDAYSDSIRSGAKATAASSE